MDSKTLSSISKQVYQRFPEVQGASPKVQSQGNTDQYLLIYTGNVKTADGKTLKRMVRVVVSAQGKIIKMSTSR